MLEASEASALSSPLLPHLPTKEEALAAGFPYAYRWRIEATGRSDQTVVRMVADRGAHMMQLMASNGTVPCIFPQSRKFLEGSRTLPLVRVSQPRLKDNMSMCVYKSLYEHSNIQNILLHIFIFTCPTPFFFTVVCNCVTQTVFSRLQWEGLDSRPSHWS